MMISPESFANEMRDKPYETLIKERDSLIRSIRRYEKGNVPQEEYMICPSPDVIYQCELEYLSQICLIMRDKYYGWKNPDELDD